MGGVNTSRMPGMHTRLVRGSGRGRGALGVRKKRNWVRVRVKVKVKKATLRSAAGED